MAYGIKDHSNQPSNQYSTNSYKEQIGAGDCTWRIILITFPDGMKFVDRFSKWPIESRLSFLLREDCLAYMDPRYYQLKEALDYFCNAPHEFKIELLWEGEDKDESLRQWMRGIWINNTWWQSKGYNRIKNIPKFKEYQQEIDRRAIERASGKA